MRQYRERRKVAPAPTGRLQRISWNLFAPFYDRFRPLHFICSLCGVGYLPFCPGTWGSLATLLVCLLLYPILSVGFVLIGIVFLFILGFATLIPLMQKQRGRSTDPSYVVIDEAVGQLIALLPVVGLLHYWPVAFVTFRFFDIKKPLLVSWPELNLHGTPVSLSLGILLDDVIAGIYAAGVTYFIFFVASTFF